jgi:hypothetical protein
VTGKRSSAELRARRAEAAAVDADFTRACGEHIYDQPFDWGMWAGRLSTKLRSLLDQLAADQAVLVLSESNEAILGKALADAIAYRTPKGICPDCDTHPSGLCDDHAGDLDRTDAYLALARELGIEVQR